MGITVDQASGGDTITGKNGQGTGAARGDGPRHLGARWGSEGLERTLWGRGPPLLSLSCEEGSQRLSSTSKEASGVASAGASEKADPVSAGKLQTECSCPRREGPSCPGEEPRDTRGRSGSSEPVPGIGQSPHTPRRWDRGPQGADQHLPAVDEAGLELRDNIDPAQYRHWVDSHLPTPGPASGIRAPRRT
ncbi:hypothetical protein PAL_GLEAN10001876 [Pteropus alecto]|uniref:Uncharacterized protein n=1 Tax=Pteropus alecto TaxID=9402 RepID=L5K9B5_PTEAL|nr:hypothetical protein PAL_GLEAN10001876 [Pteropus alecto]